MLLFLKNKKQRLPAVQLSAFENLPQYLGRLQISKNLAILADSTKMANLGMVMDSRRFAVSLAILRSWTTAAE